MRTYKRRLPIETGAPNNNKILFFIRFHAHRHHRRGVVVCGATPCTIQAWIVHTQVYLGKCFRGPMLEEFHFHAGILVRAMARARNLLDASSE